MDFQEFRMGREDHLDHEKQRIKDLYKLGERQLSVLAPFMGEKSKRKNFKKMDREEKRKMMKKHKVDTEAIHNWIQKTRKEDLTRIKEVTRKIEGSIKGLSGQHRAVMTSRENLYLLLHDPEKEREKQRLAEEAAA